MQPADVLDQGFILQFEGKPIQFAPMDNIEVASLYQDYLEQQAWRIWQRSAKWLTPQEHQDQGDGIRRDCVAGVYAHGSRFWLESLRSMVHQKKLVHLMALFHDREIPAEAIERIYKDQEKLKDLLGKVFKGFDPNSQTPPAGPAAA